MLRSVKPYLSSWLPVSVVERYRRLRRPRIYYGEYANWAAARAASRGYDDGAVLQKALAAAREVAAGRACWERDGVTFQQKEINASLLAVLRRIAKTEGDRLELVDFGGALGSTWGQHRDELADIGQVSWRVVEQPHYVEAGREFANDRLGFYVSIGASLKAGPADSILLSGVLSYLEDPGAVLAEVAALGFRHVVIDRTAFAEDGRQKIVVQHPLVQSGCSYPCWLFEPEKLLAPLKADYQVAEEWRGFDDYPRAYFRSYHFTRKTS